MSIDRFYKRKCLITCTFTSFLFFSNISINPQTNEKSFILSSKYLYKDESKVLQYFRSTSWYITSLI